MPLLWALASPYTGWRVTMKYTSYSWLSLLYLCVRGADSHARHPSTRPTLPDDRDRTFVRTVIFVKLDYMRQDEIFLRGGYGPGANCWAEADVPLCQVIPIRHRLIPRKNCAYWRWSLADFRLDWKGAEVTQRHYRRSPPEGTPLMWTTDYEDSEVNLPEDGFGYTPLNTMGIDYWMVDLDMDCSGTEGWFEARVFVNTEFSYLEPAVRQGECTGSAGGKFPYASTNHVGRCGFINIFHFGNSSCQINNFPEG